MKKILLTTVTLLTALNIFAQGTYQGAVNFSNQGSGNYITDPSGNLAAGTAYRVALYWGAANETDDRNLTQIGASAAMLSGLNAGYFNNFGRTITYPDTVATGNGAVLAFQVRGWASRGGTLLSWDAAVAAGAETGKSAIFTVDTQDPNNLQEPKPNIGDYMEFAPVHIPEPSVYALGLLGAGALLFLRRRK